MRKGLIFLFALSILTNMAFSQAKVENLKIDWPDEYKWKIGSDQENAQQHMLELVPGNETIDKWHTLGTMLSFKGLVNVPINSIPDAMLTQAKQTAPEAKLTIFERDEKAKHPWIIFKIEAPGFTSDPRPESQIFYVVQGDTALYDNFVSIKEKTITDDFAKKWIAVFKASELVYK